MEIIIALVLIAVILVLAAVRRKGGKVPRTQDHPYKTIGPLFTAAERSFYGVLTQAVEGNATVFGKVRVADVLETTKGLNPSDRTKAFNRISAKHFDFVICDPSDLSVICVVELDDSSHSSKKSQIRDDFINNACEAAGLKLHRFKAKSSYTIPDIKQTLFPLTGSAAEHLDLPEVSSNFSEIVSNSEEDINPPTCPKCSSPLIAKDAKRGKHAGSTFLACSAFPKCRYIAPH